MGTLEDIYGYNIGADIFNYVQPRDILTLLSDEKVQSDISKRLSEIDTSGIPITDFDSSWIDEYYYNEQMKALTIVTDGTSYTYYNVPPILFQTMNNYASKGTFINTFIKGNYAFSRS
jgi:hypothetical protein